jgi:hypothetical protein
MLVENAMPNFQFAGKQRDLSRYLEKGGLFEELRPILQSVGLSGNFTITPVDLEKATSHNKGELRFRSATPGGVRGIYHPPNVTGKNITFILSKPSDMVPEVFLSKLTDAQKAVLEATSRSMKSATHTVLEAVQNMTEAAQQVNGKLAPAQSPTIFDNQEALSLVITSLRAETSKLGAEFLTLPTAKSIVMNTLDCGEEQALQTLSELCEGELVTKKGKGVATTYSVSKEEHDQPQGSEMFLGMIEEGKKILERVEAAQKLLKEKEPLLKDAKERRERLLKTALPKVEEEIADLESQTSFAKKLLESNEAKKAVEMSRLLSSFNMK